uniref:Uncharacterized protein n=1 Tax=Oryza sativa subsp. japonica TaxID=39947 RepID=Q69V31_ORYSJ|nr:hypothetical protein [Oryza sativa Japonica Group]BAD35647.1 hypothetical protein [Oryza sativa Japonica Group]
MDQHCRQGILVDWISGVLGDVGTRIYTIRHQSKQKTRIILVQAPHSDLELDIEEESKEIGSCQIGLHIGWTTYWLETESEYG